MKKYTEDEVKCMQEIIDELRKMPKYQKFVNDHNLKSIKKDYSKLDELLDKGILT